MSEIPVRIRISTNAPATNSPHETSTPPPAPARPTARTDQHSMPDDPGARRMSAGPAGRANGGDGRAGVHSRGDAVELCEVVGDAAQPGRLVALGELLSLVDMAAGRCAAAHVGGTNVVTGSFDSVRLYTRVCHADVVTARACVVSAGSRSMLVRVDALREPTAVPSQSSPDVAPTLVLW